MNYNTYDYRKNQGYTADRPTTSAIRGGLDNASVPRCKLMKELRPIWEKQGLFLFLLPPYSPYLNIAESLWRILKGKSLGPVDYLSTASSLYATNRALAAFGSELNINFAHAA